MDDARREADSRLAALTLLLATPTRASQIGEKAKRVEAKKHKSVTPALFVVNNLNYVLVGLRADLSLSAALSEAGIQKRERDLGDAKRRYVAETTAKVTEALRDNMPSIEYAKRGGKMTTASAHAIKDRFAAVNSWAESQLEAQRALSVPDPELRAELRYAHHSLLLQLAHSRVFGDASYGPGRTSASRLCSVMFSSSASLYRMPAAAAAKASPPTMQCIYMLTRLVLRCTGERSCVPCSPSTRPSSTLTRHSSSQRRRRRYTCGIPRTK